MKCFSFLNWWTNHWSSPHLPTEQTGIVGSDDEGQQRVLLVGMIVGEAGQQTLLGMFKCPANFRQHEGTPANVQLGTVRILQPQQILPAMELDCMHIHIL